MKESLLQSSVLQYLNSLPGCIAENVSGDSRQSGRPDINGCYKGKSFRIELKVLEHGNKPSRKQIYNLYKWLKAGSMICVAYTLQDVKLFLHAHKDYEPWFHPYQKNCFSFAYYTKGRNNEFIKDFEKRFFVQN